MRDVRTFLQFLGVRNADKRIVLEYKDSLLLKYTVTSANSMLAALSKFLRFLGRDELCVKQFKVQRHSFCSEEKELTKDEYRRLIFEAEKKKNEKLSLLIQTICSSGIRVSELEFITVEAVKRGEARVSLKGKTREIYIIPALRAKLLRFAKSKGIISGVIFRSESGKPICRTTVWRKMKALCKGAGVSESKVFPHNLRHLFARTFWEMEKDIVKLADILGHSSINTTRIYTVSTGIEHKRRMENMRLLL